MSSGFDHDSASLIMFLLLCPGTNSYSSSILQLILWTRIFIVPCSGVWYISFYTSIVTNFLEPVFTITLYGYRDPTLPQGLVKYLQRPIELVTEFAQSPHLELKMDIGHIEIVLNLNRKTITWRNDQRRRRPCCNTPRHSINTVHT